MSDSPPFRIDVTPIFAAWQKLAKNKTIVKAASRYAWIVVKVYNGRKLHYSAVFCYLADREHDKRVEHHFVNQLAWQKWA